MIRVQLHTRPVHMHCQILPHIIIGSNLGGFPRFTTNQLQERSLISLQRDSKITICNTNGAHTFKHVCADTLCIISHCTPYTIKPVCYIVHVHRYTIYFTHHSGDFPELCSLLPLYIQTVQKCHPFNSCLYNEVCCTYSNSMSTATLRWLHS